MSQVLNADGEEDISDSKSLLESEIDLDDIDDKNLMTTFLATDVGDSCKKVKKDSKLVAPMKKNKTTL